jgi:hypothetical protein
LYPTVQFYDELPCGIPIFVNNPEYDDVENIENKVITQSLGEIRVIGGERIVSLIKLSSLFAFSVVVILLVGLYSGERRNIIYPIRPKSVINNRVKVVLFGDSLIDVPFSRNALDEKIRRQFPFYLLDIENEGIGGNKIHNLRERMYGDVVSKKPDIILLYWDSDISDQDADYLEEKSTELQYKEDLSEVVRVLKNTSKLAVAGPGLLGEGPLFSLNYFYRKNGLLDQYREITMNSSQENGILYEDIRKALKDSIPSAWIFSMGFCTMDGEHPNERGSQIIAEQFGLAINLFLSE